MQQLHPDDQNGHADPAADKPTPTLIEPLAASSANGDAAPPAVAAVNGHARPQRQRFRVQSVSGPLPQFNLQEAPRPFSKPVTVLNGGGGPTPEAFPSPTFSHARSRSVTTIGYPDTPPASASLFSPGFQNGTAAPGSVAQPLLSQSQTRRHSRIHSRNLSIYFPRPGATPVHSISEDGGQEIEIPIPNNAPSSPPPPSIVLQSAPPAKQKFGEGFKFGGKPPPSTSAAEAFPPLPPVSQPDAVVSRRRGHHHRHSVSHSFFSFMDPAATSPSPTSANWEAVTPFPQTVSFAQPEARPLSISNNEGPSLQALMFSIVQFVLGVSIWVKGQQVGSLSCTGLGYWLVFDASGIFLARVLPQYLALPSSKTTHRRYGNARVETLALFTQALYLIFIAVYTSKEALEHLILSAHDAGEGHHHHPGDELEMIAIPRYHVLLAMCSIALSGITCGTHLRLVDAVGNQVPFSTTYFSTLIRRRRVPVVKQPLERNWSTLFSNPYSAAPLLFSILLLGIDFLLPSHLHRPGDIFLAALETVITLSVSYPAALSFGKVLLQTAPSRGMLSGRMESFLKVMKELERHPQVRHVPPPHIWQLTAPSHGAYAKGKYAPETLIVTLELHVDKDLDNETILSMTRWTWERVMSAIGGSGVGEVTVGIVRD